MLSGIPLFPAQASTLAAEVDNLYFFIVAVTAFFAHRSSSIVVDLLRGQVPRPTIRLKVGAPIHGSIPLELGLVDHPVPHLDRDLRLGDGRLLRPRAAAGSDAARSTPPASAGCGVPAPRRPERDQRAARPSAGR